MNSSSCVCSLRYPHCQLGKRTLTNLWTSRRAHSFKSVWLAPCFDTRSNKPCRSADSGIHCRGLISQPCYNHAFILVPLCIRRMTGLRRLSSSLVVTCPKHFFCVHIRFNLRLQCATRPLLLGHSLALSMSDQVPSSVPDLMGIEPGSPDHHACSLAGTPRNPRRLCQRPPFPRTSPQHCRPKGRLLKTCLSLALKSALGAAPRPCQGRKLLVSALQ